MTHSLLSAAFNTLNSPAARILVDRWTEVINVKDYGAVGNGSHDDTSAIQAAFDAAFGTSASPHGIANAHLNKPLYIPKGDYVISSLLTLKHVYEGYIFGGGKLHSSMGENHTTLAVDGMVNSRMEINFQAGYKSAGAISLELDWNGTWAETGDTGLHGNVISCGYTYGDVGVRVAHSGNDGANNIFMGGGGGFAGSILRIEGSNAVGNKCLSFGGNDSSRIVHVVGGCLDIFLWGSMADASVYNIVLENTVGHTTIIGIRSESDNFASIAGDATISGVHQNIYTATFLNMTGSGRVLVQSCWSGAKCLGTGSLYQRNAAINTSQFSGNIRYHVPLWNPYGPDL